MNKNEPNLMRSQKANFRFLLFIVFVFLPIFSVFWDRPNANAQYDCSNLALNSEVAQWAKTYGGFSDEMIKGYFSIKATSDGGYIVACTTWSFDLGGGDIWILKLDSYGNIEWQRTYGTGQEDCPYAGIHEVKDGGYIVAGFTMASTYGTHVYWVLKLSSKGDIEWQRTYGDENEADYPYCIQLTSDGGYIIAGITWSFGAGACDIWILKLTSYGDIEWQRTYGGSGDDWVCESIHQTGDGGYIVGGSTTSFGAGSYDFWVLKLAANGDIEWQRTYGGKDSEYAFSIHPTEDGGYIIGGYTETHGAGHRDGWILKLSAAGNVEWQRTYGGEAGEICAVIYPTHDGGYIFASGTSSFGGGGKDIWIVNLNKHGDIRWQRTYGGKREDYSWSIQETSDGGYVFAGGTRSFGAGGDEILIMKLGPNGDIPHCGVIGTSNASVSETSIAPSDTFVTPMDTNIIPKNTNIQPRESDGSVCNLCPGPHTLALSTSSGGTTDPAPGIYTYNGGAYVTLEALPSSGYSFNGWSGDATGTFSSIEIVMDSDKSITANFTKESGDDGKDESGDDGGGSCFVATACFGTSMAEEVKILCAFRDQCLSTSATGKALVKFYDYYSPKVANFIKDKELPKMIVRESLKPVIWIISWLVER